MKQVLLLGDSIRLGYCPYVKDLLKDQAEVIYPSGNCHSSQYIIMNLQSFVSLCDKDRVALVHFNCGHWDAEHFGDSEPLTSLTEYGKNLRIIVRSLRTRFPNAKLIFATTTPMNPSYPKTGNNRTTEDLMRYNEVACKVMQEMDVEVNDLFATAKDWREDSFIDFCHMTADGYQKLADRVCERITRNI